MSDHSIVSDLLRQQGPDYLVAHQGYVTAAVLAVAGPFLLFYLVSYYRLRVRDIAFPGKKCGCS